MFNKHITTIKKFKNKKVIVIGDSMLDEYIEGTSTRLSREAPVPIVDVKKRSVHAGGAANVVINLSQLEAEPIFISVLGDDKEGEVLKGIFRTHGISTDGIIIDEARSTLAKKRVSSEGHLLLRYDYGLGNYVGNQTESRIISLLSTYFRKADAIIISDYGYGVCTPLVIEGIRILQNRYKKKLVIDAKDLRKYKDISATIVKPNYEEAIHFLNVRKKAEKRDEQIEKHSYALLSSLSAQAIAVTLDKDGVVVIEREKKPYRLYTRAVSNSKAIGAGDTFISALTLGLSTAAPVLEACELGLAAANVVVQKEATAFCKLNELRQNFSPSKKIITDLNELLLRSQVYRQQGRRIVFTNGCFDILHKGHVMYLEQAKKRGDVLIVAVNNDRSIKRLKGPSRPINSLQDRLHVLSALKMVDHLVSFSKDTPVHLLYIVKPHVYVKGGDYKKEDLPEAPIVEELGGTVEILPYIKNYSTSNLIVQIKNTDYLNYFS